MNWPILPLSAWEQTGTIFRSASCAHRISLRHISREKYESAPLSVTMARKHLQFLAPPPLGSDSERRRSGFSAGLVSAVPEATAAETRAKESMF